MRLLWRVFLANALVIVTAAVALALSPATVSSPIGRTQAVVLAVSTAVLLLIDLWVLRRAFAPFERVVSFMQTVDPLRPGARIGPVSSDPDLAALGRGIDDMLDRLEHERRDSGRRQLMAQEAERRRVARELHDEVGQLLTAAMLQLDHAAATTTASPSLAEARRATESALDEVRQISRRLRPLVLDDLGLADALAALCSGITRQTDLRVSRRLDAGDLAGLSPEQELVAYRVTQESLTNAVRHARASEVEVAVVREPGLLCLSVSDDGAGIRGAPEGTGLRGMRERALLIGAALEVASSDTGTSVELRVPLDGSPDPLPEAGR